MFVSDPSEIRNKRVSTNITAEEAERDGSEAMKGGAKYQLSDRQKEDFIQSLRQQ